MTLEDKIVLTLITISIIATSIGLAKADSIDVNVASYHFDDTYDYNQFNAGAGYTKDINKHWQAKAGFFENSFDKTSVYAMGRLKFDADWGGMGVNFGLMTGYDNIVKPGMPDSIKNLNKYQLVVIPALNFKLFGDSYIEVGYIPQIGKDTINMITLQYQHKL